MNAISTIKDFLPQAVSTKTSFYGWKEGRTWRGFFHDLYQLVFKRTLSNGSICTLDGVKNGYVSPEFFAQKVVSDLLKDYYVSEALDTVKVSLTSALKTQTIWNATFQSVVTKYPELEILTTITELNNWVLTGKFSESRSEAKKRILTFLGSQEESSLDLSRLDLTNLPDIFNHSAFTARLTIINFSRNKLTHLPESITHLQALEWLDLSFNRLASLPRFFGNLQALCSLNLECNALSSLPESFGCLKSLQGLYLHANKLWSLPESFGNLQALKVLCLKFNMRISLPKSFANLQSLQQLNLSHNLLTSLPESITHLQALQVLNLAGTHLTSLPDSFGSLQALQTLLLEKTPLTSLPDSFGNLQALQELFLMETQLISLPDSFGSLQALQTLGLHETQLTSLPDSFGNLGSLQMLSLDNTPLTSLPSTITSLPHNLRMDISTLPLSEEIRTRLRAATEAPEYNGPRFIYSMAHVERREEDLRSTVELVRDLYQELEEPPLTLSKELEESAELRAWLSRLSYMADYKAGGENKKALLQNILAYLRLANGNPEFQEAFLAIINGAADTCGDRVALSILQIGIAYKVHRADLSRPRDLAHLLLRGVYAMTLLENIARAKVLTLPFVDELEVYLGYPLKLEALELPIDVKDMLHFSCSALTDTDLQDAELFVKEQLGNQDTCNNFLIHHETWLKCLEQNYPREFRALTRTKTAGLRIDSPDYTKIQTDYDRGLVSLTKKIQVFRNDK